MIPNLVETAYSLLAAAVFAAGPGIAWLMDLADRREEERRRPVDPPAPADYGTGVQCAARPASALPRSPQTPVSAGSPRLPALTGPHALVDAGGHQTAAPTSPNIRRVGVHG